MTTNVKVTAHCDSNTQVAVEICTDGVPVAHLTLQDGESTEQYVYDDRVITVKEVPKIEEPAE